MSANIERVGKEEEVVWVTFRIRMKFDKSQLEEFDRDPYSVIKKMLAGPLKEEGINVINGLSMSPETIAEFRNGIIHSLELVPVTCHGEKPPEYASQKIVIMLPPKKK